MFGGEGEGGIGMEVMGFLLDMPLRDVLEFQSQQLPAPADEIIAGLLQQVYA